MALPVRIVSVSHAPGCVTLGMKLADGTEITAAFVPAIAKDVAVDLIVHARDAKADLVSLADPEATR
ncbi:hypothetical protein [Hyphomonas sp.]|uniref:hypothetical protein n=1 Tax=Hyphomonas sp. TaxID=87 RepID=UPI0025C35BAD|nr:hypothetical protein [Hyphomonas sp.]